MGDRCIAVRGPQLLPQGFYLLGDSLAVPSSIVKPAHVEPTQNVEGWLEGQVNYEVEKIAGLINLSRRRATWERSRQILDFLIGIADRARSIFGLPR